METYEDKKPRYEIFTEETLNEIIENINNSENREKTLADLTNLESVISQYFQKPKITINIPDLIKNSKRKIGYDSPDLKEDASRGSEKRLYVSQQFLNNLARVSSGRVLGAYDRSTDTIYILDTLSGDAHDEVLFHERYHRHNPQASELETRLATARSGYNRFQGVGIYN